MGARSQKGEIFIEYCTRLTQYLYCLLKSMGMNCGGPLESCLHYGPRTDMMMTRDYDSWRNLRRVHSHRNVATRTMPDEERSPHCGLG